MYPRPLRSSEDGVVGSCLPDRSRTAVRVVGVAHVGARDQRYPQVARCTGRLAATGLDVLVEWPVARRCDDHSSRYAHKTTAGTSAPQSIRHLRRSRVVAA